MLALHPAAPVLNPSVPQKNSGEKLLVLLRLINFAGKCKVDSGLKMLIETHLVLASGKPVLQKSIFSVAIKSKKDTNESFSVSVQPVLIFYSSRSFFHRISVVSEFLDGRLVGPRKKGSRKWQKTAKNGPKIGKSANYV